MRASILDSARTIFAERGYQRATMGDIAAACGISAANLYNYFTGKKAIGFAVVARYLEEVDARLAVLAASPPANPAEHLAAFVRIRIHHTVDHLRAEPRLVELAEMVLSDADQGAALVARVAAEQREALARIIARGIEAGVFAPQDAQEAARAVQLCVRYFATPRAISRYGLETAEPDLERVLALVTAGLRATPI